LGKGLACRGKCETEVASIIDLQQRNKTAYQKASGSYLRMAAGMAAFGLLLAAFGVLSWSGGQGLILVVFGLFMLVFAALYFVSGRKYKNPN
jgi:Flp pilus assembly protein TadB